MEDSDRFEEKSFSNGDVYIGKFKGILPHGNGKYTWSDGTVYEGDWVDGKMTGKGLITWPSGAKYEGEFSGSYLHGHGSFTGSSGWVYTGGWRMNAHHGIGRKVYRNSDIYEGLWKEGVRDGSGRYTWNNGNTMYIGNWKSGKIDGRGVMKWANGDIFDGCWSNGLKQGSGVYRFADGGLYIGTWSKGLKDGKGTFYPSGSKQPSLKKWCIILNSDDNDWVLNREDHMAPKSRFYRSLSEKVSGSGRSKSSRQISHRTSSVDANWSLRNPGEDCICRDSSSALLQNFDEGQSEASGMSTMVYEREYMQGVLIMERIRENSEISHNKNRRQNKFRVKHVKKSSCIEIFRERQSYYLKLNLQLGIRYTVGKITPVPAREVRSSDFGDRARIRVFFPKEGSQLTPPHYSIDFYWKDYCPMVFRNLREMFKLDAADYMMSICGDCGLRDITSPGKSGSIFFLSQDDKFVIKTLKKYELKVLLNMLPKYYHHVGSYENTLITKFFGLHRITLRGGKKVRFVVMGNMFCTELHIHRRYDLKGSSQGRCTDKDKIKCNTTLKDLDLNYEFHMDKKLRESLFKQISLDCNFLESQHIIDYSLLLGLHFRAPENLKALVEPPGTMQRQDSLPSGDDALKQGEQLIIPKGLLLVAHEPSFVNTAPGPHIRGNTLRAYSIGDKEVDLLLPGTARLRVQLGVNMPAQATRKLQEDKVEESEVELFEVYDVVLYMGIIDILQEYNVKKKLEHAYKSMQFDPMTVSVIEPKLYADRFINFMDKVFPEETP